MLRRDFVRSALLTGLAPKVLLGQQVQSSTPPPPPPAPVPWTLGLNAKTPLPHTEIVDGIAETELRFFTAPRMAVLNRLCEVLLPATGSRPGAVQADTPRFLDFLLDESPAARQSFYSRGLDWLDAESHRIYKNGFAQISPTQADLLIRPWLRAWMTDHPPTEAHADFINIAHEDIRTATLNSKTWNQALVADAGNATNPLYWSPIEPDLWSEHAASSTVPPHVQAAPKASHTMPSYPR